MASDPYALRTELLGALPIINHFIDRIGLAASLERFVPHDDARLRVAPAKVLGLVVRNLVTHREPVYALGEWAAPTIRPCSASDRVMSTCSTTTGWDAPWNGSSTPTGPACSPKSR